MTPAISRRFSGAFIGPPFGSTTNVPPRSRNRTLRMARALHLGYGSEELIVVGRTADRDADAVGEQRIVDRAHEYAGAARGLAKFLAVAGLHHDEVRVARIHLL